MKSHTFVDSVILHAAAGSGGNGCVGFRREKFVPKGGPDGGDGGRGGHVILITDPDITSLTHIFFAPHQTAAAGGHGRGKQSHGKNGADLSVKVPCGTEVRDSVTGQVLGDLTEEGEQLIVARGGSGGLGNCHWKSSTHQAPTEHTDGEAGQQLTLRLELKIISDAGLVGFPNAGKSSLLRKITDAHPKVGQYPFTTLHPIIGTVVFEDFGRMTVADIPGLIKNAHKGSGLGHAFLRHIERAGILIYVIDMAGVDQREPAEDYRCLQEELRLHDERLVPRTALVVANKMDRPEARRNLDTFIEKTGTQPIPVSALTGEGVDKLKRALRAVRNA